MNPPPYEHLKNQVAFIVIRAYIAHAYIYYELNDSVIPDHEFDALWQFIHDNYDWIKPYDLNDYLPPKDNGTSSCFEAMRRVTGLTREYAIDLLKEHKKKIEESKEMIPMEEVTDEDFDLIG